LLNIIVLLFSQNNNNMKLHEIIESNSEGVAFSHCKPYVNSLLCYYESRFVGEPMLLPLVITNADTLVKIVDCENISEEIVKYLGEDYTEEEEASMMFGVTFLSDYIERK